jgi:hypothetical protein
VLWQRLWHDQTSEQKVECTQPNTDHDWKSVPFASPYYASKGQANSECHACSSDESVQCKCEYALAGSAVQSPNSVTALLQYAGDPKLMLTRTTFC